MRSLFRCCISHNVAPRISIKGFVRPSIRRSVRNDFSRTRARRILRSVLALFIPQPDGGASCVSLSILDFAQASARRTKRTCTEEPAPSCGSEMPSSNKRESKLSPTVSPVSAKNARWFSSAKNRSVLHICLFACTAHSFTCTALLASLARC